MTGLQDADALDVHVYVAPVSAASSESDRRRDEGLLSDEEREKWKSFRRDSDRDLYVVSHALLRRALSLHSSILPEDWRFVREEHDRPVLAPLHGSALRFSLTHTIGLAACAITKSVEIGLDAEDTSRIVAIDDVAKVVFDVEELENLAGLGLVERKRRFFELWTLKEAYLKARGFGLSRDPRLLGFRLGESGQVNVRFDPFLADDPSRWSFAFAASSGQYCLAAAIRLGDVAQLARIRWHSTLSGTEVVETGQTMLGSGV